MCPKVADRMANNVDPRSSQMCVYTVCPDVSDQTLRTVMVDCFHFQSNPTHLLAVGKCLEMFRASDKLCDFTINVNDTKFRVS